MNEEIYIGIAEDHDLVRQGLVALLKEQEGIKVLFDVSNGEELLERLKSATPDIILLDLDMPVLNGREALPKIKQFYPSLKVIIVTQFFEESFILEYVRKGVNSFLPKNCKVDTLVKAIYAVEKDGVYFDTTVSKILAKEVAEPTINDSSAQKSLSDLDRTIIKLICQNKSSKEIAEDLGLGKKNVDYHRTKIMRITQSKSLTDLFSYAIRTKLVIIL